MCNVTSDDEFESVLTGQCHRVKVHKKIVDATYSATAVPSTHPPKYYVEPGVRFAPLNDLPKVAQPRTGYVVVGSGKTGIDACLWLLEQGVGPERIRWIMPRDAWLLDRAKIQPTDEFFFVIFASLARQLEAVAVARRISDLFVRLETRCDLLRIVLRGQINVLRRYTSSP